MILPHPESDLSINVMVMASDIVKALALRGGYVFEETLMKEFLKKDNRRTADMFIDCVTFLFAFGYIEHSGHRLKLSEAALRPPQQTTLELSFNA